MKSGKGIQQADDLQKQLQKALTENTCLREENARLRALLALPAEEIEQPSQNATPEQPLPVTLTPAVTNESSAIDKVTLFRSLFRGREDVYPVRWEGKAGRSGYPPACANQWVKPLCNKHRVKCGECEHRQLLPVTDQVIYDHLAGKQTIGVYPLLSEGTCYLLAADFDKKTWREDTAAFLETCVEMGVPAALERSRSGNGGHIWIFFDQPVPAPLARKLGCTILTRSMEKRHQIGLDSYDRFFPSQDTIPKGGFGNLIALPLQRAACKSGNSMFVDGNFLPYKDQWRFMSSLRKMQPAAIEAIVHDAASTGSIIGVRTSQTEDEGAEDPWILLPSACKADKPITGPLPEKVNITLGNLVYFEKEELPSPMINRLLRIASFQNPEFYKAQAMRLSTFGIPRVIACADEFPRHIGLPRGCLDEALELLNNHGIETRLKDERFSGAPLDVTFQGKLSLIQQQAAKAMLADDTGVLAATTAFGKTVVAAWIIASRKVNTLVLVHRKQLLDQWRERLPLFLDIPAKSIGQIGGGKDKPTFSLDIGIIQSLSRKGKVKDLMADYGQIIVDECHHLSAVSFEQVLKQSRARYVMGLTATPVRKDGHHPIIMMQCGSIRFRVDEKKQAAARPFEHKVIPRHTSFTIPPGITNLSIQEIYAALVEDEARNDLIFDDLLQALEQGRSPILLTERTGHVEYFSNRLKGFAHNVIVLRGGMGKKQRQALADMIASIPDGEERVLIATGRYIGEGFDDARLDTLFLVMPISWRGTLQQYAGRLHRLHTNKREVQIYDYVDANVPMLMRMYEKRVKGYSAIGYSYN